MAPGLLLRERGLTREDRHGELAGVEQDPREPEDGQ